MITINRLLNDLNRKTHKTVNNSTDFYGACWEGATALLARIQPPELERMQFVEQALYNQVNRYAVSEDLDGNKVISLKFLPSRSNVGSWVNPLEQAFSENFGMNGGIDQYGFNGRQSNALGGFRDGQQDGACSPKLSIQYENGVKYILLPNLSVSDCQTIAKMDSITSDGILNSFGNVVNVRTDKLRYVSGNGSVAFDFNNSSTTGSIEIMLTNTVDLDAYRDIGAIFTWLDLSNFLELVSVQFQWASSLTDYWEYTVTGPHDNNQFVNDWNLLRFPFQNLTPVGVPNPKAINRIRVNFVTTGQTQVNCHLDNIVARKGSVYSTNYYSQFLFRDAITGAWKQIPTSGNDLINVEQDAYHIFMYEVACIITQEATGNFKASKYTTGTVDTNQFRQELDRLPQKAGDTGGLYYQYTRKYPSKLISPTSDAYHFMNGRL